jgi:pyruvate/2-oxoglutarate dehydrogenase complex dihydrolipoamide acyltransferase (E2) component
MDVEDENEGIMKEILVKEGDEESLKPGTPICTIMHKPMK